MDVPGALHHIMIRGNNKAAIFADDEDKRRFLERLEEYVTSKKSAIYAWVLMDNHAHLLFRSGEQSISSVMRKLLTWYAQYYNRRHHRHGHLFENRYKSILCEEDSYLLVLVRYIHLNPVRARLVKTLAELDNYPWSGHRALIGKVKKQWMDTDYVLSQFARTHSKAIHTYREFMRQGMDQGHLKELTGGGLMRSQGGWSQVVAIRSRGQQEASDTRILGSGDFVSKVLKEAEARQARQLKSRGAGQTIERIMRQECGERGIPMPELTAGSKRRPVTKARAIIALRSRNELGLSAAEIARHLGVNTSSIARAIERAETPGRGNHN